MATGTFSSVRNFGALHRKILIPISFKGRAGEGIAATSKCMNSLGNARGTEEVLTLSSRVKKGSRCRLASLRVLTLHLVEDSLRK